MANLLLSLTDAVCKGARPKNREYTLRDTRQPGLALRVQPCGSRSWIMRYRINGKPVRHLLGTFPETGVKAARQIAAALRAQDAEAPLYLPPRRCSKLFRRSMKGATQRFTSRKGCGPIAPMFDANCCPLSPGNGWMPSPDKMLCGGSRDTAQGNRGSEPGAWHPLANPSLRQNMGVCTQDVAQSRDRNQDEPAKAGRHFPEREANDRIGGRPLFPHGARLQSLRGLQLLSLTGCRVSEVLLLEWADVLPDRLHLRDSKTGPRDVPLGVPVRQFLKTYRKSLPRLAKAANAPVFSLPGQSYNAIRSVWHRVRKAANLPDTLRIHDLRHSFASHAIMAGETLFSTSRLLGHSKIQTTARYAHLADTALLDCAERVGRLILAQAGSPARNLPVPSMQKAPEGA
jgi:hypothetical protein